MVAILLTDCTVKELHVGGFKMLQVVTPATADDGDTIDMSDEFEEGCFALVVGASDGLAVSTATSYSTTITLPGSTDNEARTMLVWGN